MAKRGVVALLAVGATICALSGTARADGDPASDYLLAQDWGKPEPRLRRSLGGLQPGEGATELARAGTTAVVRLARAAGHSIPAPPEASSGNNQASDRVKIAALAVTAAVIAAAVGWFRRSRVAAR